MNGLKEWRKEGITGTGLKFLAVVFMVLDHIHYFFSYTGLIPEWFSMLGRLAMPIFLFCVAEGFAYTHDRKRYFLRIWLISAGMGAVQYGMVTGHMVRPDDFFPRNAVFMNFVILCIIWQGMDWIKEKKWGRGLAAVLLPLIWPYAISIFSMIFPATATAAGFLCYTVFPAWIIIVDGGLPYLIMGILFYGLRKNRKLQLAAFVLFDFAWFFGLALQQVSALPGFSMTQMFTQYYEWFGCFSALPLLCYNGKRGSGHKHFFYVFYVSHVYILYALSWLLMTIWQK